MYPAYALDEVATDARSNFVSTQDTILIMQQLVTESLPTPQIGAIATKLTNDIGRSPTIETICRRVFWWVKANIRLVEDEWTLVNELGEDRDELMYGSGKELLISPAYLVLQSDYDRQGDCDDFSTLVATLLIRMGIPRANVLFCTVATDRLAPESFSHVYVKVRREDGLFIVLDSSHGAYPGWETKDKYNEKYWQA